MLRFLGSTALSAWQPLVGSTAQYARPAESQARGCMATARERNVSCTRTAPELHLDCSSASPGRHADGICAAMRRIRCRVLAHVWWDPGPDRPLLSP